MFEPLIQNLNIASGQVAQALTQITAGGRNVARPMNFVFSNVGNQTETLILKISLAGATAVQIARVELDANERAELTGFPLNHNDSFLAQTTNPAAVDYLVSLMPKHAPAVAPTLRVYDEVGRLKTVPYIIEQLDAVLD